MKKWIFGAAILMGVVSMGGYAAVTKTYSKTKSTTSKWSENAYPNPSSESVVEIRDKDYEDFVSQGYAVVEFYKPGCSHCERTWPHYQKVAGEMASEARFAKFNVSAGHMGRQVGINLTPTFVVYRDGKEIGRSRGAANADKLRAFFERMFNGG